MSLYQVEEDGRTIKIGDRVRFKSDVEQTGEVVKITKVTQGTGHDLMLTNETEGFFGKYIGGRFIHTVNSRDLL